MEGLFIGLEHKWAMKSELTTRAGTQEFPRGEVGLLKDLLILANFFLPFPPARVCELSAL